jgi:saccharopine dehydrogenase-like NADP-dependent oxidoreductase
MVVMQHQIEYLINDEIKSEKFSLVILGKDNEHTAMAHTVGLPLGIVAKLILENKLTELSGVVIPTVKDIYLPVIEELKEFGVNFMKQ